MFVIFRLSPTSTRMAHSGVGSPDEEHRPWSEAYLLQWFRAGNYREYDQCRLVIPAMDILNKNDSGNLNNTEVVPADVW